MVTLCIALLIFWIIFCIFWLEIPSHIYWWWNISRNCEHDWREQLVEIGMNKMYLCKKCGKWRSYFR